MSLEQTIGNLEIRYANVVTFVGSSNTMVDTTTGRIQTKGFQHNSNVITDISGPHGRIAPTLKKYPEIAFGASKVDRNDTTNTYVQAGYTVMASSYAAAQEPYRAFDYSGAGGGSVTWTTASITNLYGNGSGLYGTVRTSNLGLDTGGTATPQGGTRENGEWITLQIPNKITLSSITISRVDSDTTAGPKDFQLYGSNDGTTWVQILSETGADPSTTGTSYTPTSTPVAYTYFGLVVTRTISRTDYMTINDLVFYGTEENPPTGDHSVDTTFKSRFNNPQLTGVQVLVDGATGVGTNHISGGPDPSGNQVTMTSPNKYWTLNGTLTSNLSVEANTFLEGDQPHAVSVWFNSSNLEANVSNTCVFSISDQEKLDSVNLDLQSNTWHNLTYAYQGEGGSRVTYLDGRKVAEDQAEDTFGDYPPFAMTGYSQGGYVVSASNFTSTYYPWTAFDGLRGDVGEGWFTDGGLYTIGGDGAATSSATEFPVGTGRRGEYLDLEMPHKLKVSYFVIQTRNTSHTKIPEDSPHEGYLYGSNDGINWTVIKFFSGLTYGGAGVNSAAEESVSVNSTTAYKYLRLQATKRGAANGSDSYVGIGELKYYGHRENDLVRLPDPTNVLKYPHIAMTGYAQRGYVVSSNNEYTGDGRLAWKAYDAFDLDSGENAWMTKDPSWTTATPGEPTGTGDNAPDTFTVGGVNYTGHWNKLELPHKIRVSQIYMSSRMSTRLPYKGVFLGSDDDSSWEVIYSFNNTLTWSAVSGVGQATTITGITNTNSYKYVMLVVQQINGSDDRLWLNQIKYYGTGVDSIPIQVGGGNIDKVANFRVYDKFIGEDQVNEIWNAQKEEFGRAKPQMVLQQGKLGIGTDAPQGSLSVADEPHAPEEFPPRAMTANNTYFEGHGTFKAASEWTRDSAYEPFAVFNKYTHDTNVTGPQDRMWWSSINAFTGNPGVFNGDTSKNIGGYTGVGLKIEMPYSILCNRIDLYPRNPYGYPQYTQNPRAFKFIASKDNEFWDLLHEETNFVDRGGTAHPFHINTTQYYKYFAIVVTGVGNSTLVSIVDLQYFGTREQGQSVLHDGQLTLTKSLNVPRIGPPLDADDTPRRDRLVVEYNTSTNPTFEGAVRDTSGRGNDAMLYNGASYSAIRKELVFDGSNDYARSVRLNNTGGDYIHSVSWWFKTDITTSAIGTNEDVMWHLGDAWGARICSYASFYDNRLYLAWHTYNINCATTNIKQLQWNHACVTYTGGGSSLTSRKFYLNGQLEPATLDNTEGTLLNLPANTLLTLGARKPTATNTFASTYFDGRISDFKLYDTALTAEEARTLYDMGRNGSVANPQPLHIAAPLYAPGVPVQIVSKVYKKQVAYGSTNSDRNIKELDISIKPKFANSRILLHWMINGELHQDNVIRVARDGSYIIHGYNETQGTNQWSGVAAGAYDQNQDSTPSNFCIDTYDEPGGTNTYNYQIYIGSSSTGNYPAYINRTYIGGASNYHEAGICFMSATEIAQ